MICKTIYNDERNDLYELVEDKYMDAIHLERQHVNILFWYNYFYYYLLILMFNYL